MSRGKTLKSEYIPNIRVEPEIKIAFEDLADMENLPVSTYVYRILMDHLQKPKNYNRLAKSNQKVMRLLNKR